MKKRILLILSILILFITGCNYVEYDDIETAKYIEYKAIVIRKELVLPNDAKYYVIFENNNDNLYEYDSNRSLYVYIIANKDVANVGDTLHLVF